MKTATRRIAIAVSTALIATTTIAPMASAQDWQGQHRERQGTEHRAWQGEQRRGHDDSAAWIGLGIAALVGVAIAANATQPPQVVYAPPPSYVQPGPTCTTINGYAVCIGPDGNWQYVR